MNPPLVTEPAPADAATVTGCVTDPAGMCVVHAGDIVAEHEAHSAEVLLLRRRIAALEAELEAMARREQQRAGIADGSAPVLATASSPTATADFANAWEQEHEGDAQQAVQAFFDVEADQPARRWLLGSD